jgi:hypothetical protein
LLFGTAIVPPDSAAICMLVIATMRTSKIVSGYISRLADEMRSRLDPMHAAKNTLTSRSGNGANRRALAMDRAMDRKITRRDFLNAVWPRADEVIE